MPADDSQAAVVTKISGTVYAQRHGTRVALAEGDAVRAADTIITDSDSRAEVRFADDAVVTLSPGTTLEVREFVYGSGRDSFILNLSQGAMRSVSGEVVRHNPDAFKILTPRAAVGIRGTELFNSVQGDHELHAVLFISDGHIVVVTANDGRSVTLDGAMQAVRLAPGETGPLVVQHFSLREMEELIRAIDPGQATDLPGEAEHGTDYSTMPGVVILHEATAAGDSALTVDGLEGLGRLQEALDEAGFLVSTLELGPGDHTSGDGGVRGVVFDGFTASEADKGAALGTNTAPEPGPGSNIPSPPEPDGNTVPLLGGVTDLEVRDGDPSVTGKAVCVDPDRGDTHTFSLTGNGMTLQPDGSLQSAYGTCAVDADGNYTYTPNAAAVRALAEGETAQEVFTLVVTDAHGATARQDVTVTIHGDNDAPVLDAGNSETSLNITAGSSTDSPGRPYTVSGVIRAEDVDHGDVLSYFFSTDEGQKTQFPDLYGVWSINSSTGEYTYTLYEEGVDDELYSGDTQNETITVGVRDTHGAFVATEVTVTITGSAREPIQHGYVNMTNTDRSAYYGTPDKGPTQPHTLTVTGELQTPLGLNADTIDASTSGDATVRTAGDTATVQEIWMTGAEPYEGIYGDAAQVNGRSVVTGNDVITVGNLFTNSSVIGDVREVVFSEGARTAVFGEDELRVTKMENNTTVIGDALTVTGGEVVCGDDSIVVGTMTGESSSRPQICGDAQIVENGTRIVFGDDHITVSTLDDSDIYGDAKFNDGQTQGGGNDHILVDTAKADFSVVIDGGPGDDEIRLGLADKLGSTDEIGSVHAYNSLEVLGGEGQDTIAVHNIKASRAPSSLFIDGGTGQDEIRLSFSESHEEIHVTVALGQEDTLTLENGPSRGEWTAAFHQSGGTVDGITLTGPGGADAIHLTLTGIALENTAEATYAALTESGQLTPA